MRYVGQGHEIAVPLPVEEYGAEHASLFLSAFEHEYTQLYGRTISGIDVEVLSWTLTLSAPVDHLENDTQSTAQEADDVSSSSQTMFDPRTSKRVEVPVLHRAQMRPGDSVAGPALITEAQTTTVVSSSFNATIDARAY